MQNNPAEEELRINRADSELQGLAELFEAAVSQAADARFFEVLYRGIHNGLIVYDDL